jgi:hypothetical protein
MEFDFEAVLADGMVRYIAAGKEICPTTKRMHYQSYLVLKKPLTKSKKNAIMLSEKYNLGHTEWMIASLDKNEKYCSKEALDGFKEWGDKPQQGKRVDLDLLAAEIKAGKRVDDIAEDQPMAFHQYGRTMDRLEAIALRRKYRKWMTEGIWYYGPTGTGKSYRVFNDPENPYSEETHYVFNFNDGGFWDGYHGQETIIVNEFRGQIQYSELLDLVDNIPKKVKQKGKESVPFLAKKFYITSSMPPWEVYAGVAAKDSLKQLERRFAVHLVTDKTDKPVKVGCRWSEGNNGTSDLQINVEKGGLKVSWAGAELN